MKSASPGKPIQFCKKIKSTLLIVFLFLFITGYAQETDKSSFKEKFIQANYHVEYENYNLAVPIFKELVAMEPENANINYKLGFCYLKSNRNKKEAKSYLEKAALNTSGNYDDLDPFEKKAPITTFYYLGIAYHITYKIDDAIASFEKFKSSVNKKHYLIPDADRKIEICNNARQLIATPTKVEITNLKGSINGSYADYGPVISVDESVLIFTSRRPAVTGPIDETGDQYNEDIYFSHKDKNGNWSVAKSIGDNINTSEHEASIGLSADGQTLFIYKGEEGGSIYMSELVGNNWSVPIRLDGNINTSSWETHAALSADGQVIYFTSNRSGGFGGKDIYMCKKLPNGQWGRPQNLGPTINTKYDEDAPFIHPDAKTIYFSSEGHKSMGGFDIFFAEIKEDGTWSDPINIGYPINTTDDDAFYVTSADGKRAYYSSLREEGLGEKDIYLISLVEATEKPITVLIGYIKTSTGEALPSNILVSVTDLGTGETLPYRPNTASGKYVLTLHSGENYRLTYTVGNNEVYNEEIYIPDGTAYNVINKEIELNATITLEAKDKLAMNTGDKNNIKINDINKINDKVIVKEPATKEKIITQGSGVFQQFFNYNVRQIDSKDPKFAAFIDSLVLITKQQGYLNLDIESSASNVPTKTYGSNERLTLARAEQAKIMILKALKLKGVDESKIFVISISMFVQGPVYNQDFRSQKSAYEKYQYIKISAK